MMRKTRSLSILMLTLLFSASGANAKDAEGLIAASDQPQVTQPPQGGVNWKGVGIAAGTVASNLVYVPAKLVYGILGGIGGGAGYALTGGNKQVADTIWQNSLGGDYVLTPKKLTGQEPIYFSGPNGAGPAQNLTAAESQSHPNRTASSLAPSLSTSDAEAATRPMDRGSGPVDAATTLRPDRFAAVNDPGAAHPRSKSRGRPRRIKPSHLPDTSIE